MSIVKHAACIIGACLLGGAAQAQSKADTPPAAPADPDAPVGKQAGTFMLRLRAIGVMPETSSSISVIGGGVNVTKTATPEFDLSYFFTAHIAAEIIAATTRHEASASNTALGNVDVGSVWVLPPTVTAQYHFMPQSRFSPYLGAGMTLAIFYDVHKAGPTVTSLHFSNNVGAAIQAGFDYNLRGHWFLNFDVKQIFLNTTATINGAISARTTLDPTIVGAGIGYRF